MFHVEGTFKRFPLTNALLDVKEYIRRNIQPRLYNYALYDSFLICINVHYLKSHLTASKSEEAAAVLKTAVVNFCCERIRIL